MKIKMKNPSTGEKKEIKVGFSWILLLFSSFLGIPLFLRKLYIWGGMFLLLWTLTIIAPSLMGSEEEMFILEMVLNILTLGLAIWMGVKGNEMTAKNYLENNWSFEETDSNDVKFAKKKWGITV